MRGRSALTLRTIAPADFEGYLRDLLHRALDADTAERLKGDRDFTEAYEFPYRREDEWRTSEGQGD